MSSFVSVGRNCWVRSSEVIAIHDGQPTSEEIERMPISTFVKLDNTSQAVAIIVLRDGSLFPSYITPGRLTKRLEGSEEAAPDA